MNLPQENNGEDPNFSDIPYGPIFAKHIVEVQKLAESIDRIDAHEAVMDGYDRAKERHDPDTPFLPLWKKATRGEACRAYSQKQRRKELRIPYAYLMELSADPGDPFALLCQQDLHEKLVIALSKLSDKSRRLLVLRYLEGLDYCELAVISEFKGQKIGTLRAWNNRALAALRKAISDLRLTDELKPATAPDQIKPKSFKSKVVITQ